VRTTHLDVVVRRWWWCRLTKRVVGNEVAGGGGRSDKGGAAHCPKLGRHVTVTCRLAVRRGKRHGWGGQCAGPRAWREVRQRRRSGGGARAAGLVRAEWPEHHVVNCQLCTTGRVCTRLYPMQTSLPVSETRETRRSAGAQGEQFQRHARLPCSFFADALDEVFTRSVTKVIDCMTASREAAKRSVSLPPERCCAGDVRGGEAGCAGTRDLLA
jgi:hypothetical protein